MWRQTSVFPTPNLSLLHSTVKHIWIGKGHLFGNMHEERVEKWVDILSNTLYTLIAPLGSVHLF